MVPNMAGKIPPSVLASRGSVIPLFLRQIKEIVDIETGLEGLDDEPRTVVVDDLFGEHGALCDEHSVFLSGPPAI